MSRCKALGDSCDRQQQTVRMRHAQPTLLVNNAQMRCHRQSANANAKKYPSLPDARKYSHNLFMKGG